MKKVVFLTGSFLIAIAFSSCKKEYTCKCTYNDPFGNPTTYQYTIKDTKKKAKDACESYTITGATNLKCELE